MKAVVAPPSGSWPVPPLRPPGALLKLGYRCNNGCRFCHSAPHRGVDLDSRAAEARIRQAVAAGVARVVLSGGEPTLRRDVVDLVRLIRDLGCEPGIVTNGRMLSYPKLREALGAAGLSQVYLSLHSHRPEVHDALVRVPGAHAQVRRALAWLGAQPGIALRVNAVLTRTNLDDLEGLARLVAAAAAPRGPQGAPVTLTYSFVEPEGNALEAFEALVPDLRTAGQQVERVLARLGPALQSRGVVLAADGFPPCVLSPERGPRSDLWTEGFVFVAEAFEAELCQVDEAHKRRGARCHGCSVDGCAGVYATYLDRRGEAALTPVRARRGSSVDFVDQGGVHGFPRTLSECRACPSHQRVLPHPDPRREVLVSGPDGVRLWRADATDFPEQALASIVREQRQLYRVLDPREEAVDFSTSLRKLALAPGCAECPHRGACGGLWQDAPQDVLGPDEAEVRAHLAGLRGRVLDVGCGAAAYLAELAPEVRAGRVTLHLLDPDPAAARRVEAFGLPHQFFELPVERFEPKPPSGAAGGTAAAAYDHVLSIRSYSHFVDVDQAAQVIAAALRPGGQLTVVGDSAVALVRSAAGVTAARRAGRLPEHWRNHGPAEARVAFEAAGLKLVWERPVQPDRSNLWWLVMRRPSRA